MTEQMSSLVRDGQEANCVSPSPVRDMALPVHVLDVMDTADDLKLVIFVPPAPSVL